jgi:hypothetical protein
VAEQDDGVVYFLRESKHGVSKKLIFSKIALAQYAFQVGIRIDLVRINGKDHLTTKCFTWNTGLNEEEFVRCFT